MESESTEKDAARLDEHRTGKSQAKKLFPDPLDSSITFSCIPRYTCKDCSISQDKMERAHTRGVMLITHRKLRGGGWDADEPFFRKNESLAPELIHDRGALVGLHHWPGLEGSEAEPRTKVDSNFFACSGSYVEGRLLEGSQAEPLWSIGCHLPGCQGWLRLRLLRL